MSRLPGTLRAVLFTIALALTALAVAPGTAQAVRHHSYVGTITFISNNALTIHSKTHNANFQFVINNQTRFLQHGLAIPRTNFKVGSYVTVSYSPGPKNTMITYHISLRR